MTRTELSLATGERVLAMSEDQHRLLWGLVARAAQDEYSRVGRMRNRPTGSHSPEKISEAERLARDLHELEIALASLEVG